MSRFFLHYWTDAICEDAVDSGEDATPLAYCAGDDALWGAVSPGDVVYVINVMHGEVYLVGSMQVGTVTSSPSEAWKRVGDKARAALYHAVARKGSGTPQYFTRVLPPDQLRLLQFIDASGETQSLSDGGVQRSRVRGLHETDARSAAVLDAYLALPYHPSDDEEMDSFGDDDEEFEAISDGEMQDIMAQYEDEEQNDRIAITAIAAARHELETRGFVYDAPADAGQPSYDFTVSHEGGTRRVVVRGVVDIAPAFLIDDRALRLLEDDRSALLCIVTDVLGGRRSVAVMNGDEFFDDFETRTVLHAARPIE